MDRLQPPRLAQAGVGCSKRRRLPRQPSSSPVRSRRPRQVRPSLLLCRGRQLQLGLRLLPLELLRKARQVHGPRRTQTADGRLLMSRPARVRRRSPQSVKALPRLVPPLAQPVPPLLALLLLALLLPVLLAVPHRLHPTVLRRSNPPRLVPPRPRRRLLRLATAPTAVPGRPLPQPAAENRLALPRGAPNRFQSCLALPGITGRNAS